MRSGRGGIIAPLLGGYLLVINDAFTVYVSIVILTAAGVCVLFLSNTHSRNGRSGGYEPIVPH